METNFLKIRNDFNLSQSAMAELCGVHKGTWIKWENGSRRPDIAALRLLQVLTWVRANGHLEALKAHLKGE